MTHTQTHLSPSRVKPLAIALALACAGLIATDGAMAAHALPDSGSIAGRTVAERPDGSLLWPVNNCNDAGPGSLRDAAAHANHGDGIDLSALACSTISVTSGSIGLRDVELIGPGAAALAIKGSGNQGRRLFNHVGNGGSLTIRDVTVQGAKYQSDAGQGGACLRSTNGALRIHDSVFDACLAFAPVGTAGAVRGGAIAAYGDYLLLSNVTLSGNQARSANGVALGGALYMAGNELDIRDSTISNNAATAVDAAAVRRGGGVFTRGWAWIETSTLDGNLSQGGGGGAVIEAGGMLIDSTVSGNSAVGGASGIAFLGMHAAMAGVYSSTIVGNETEASTQWGTGALYMNTSPATIANSTIAGNVESNMQGIAHGAGIVFGPLSGSDLTMISTIAFGNHIRDFPTGADIGGPLGATLGGDHNLIGLSYIQVPADTLRFTDPLLGPLQDNGGPTWTRAPASGSAAIDHGNDNGRVTDQRGFPRLQGSAADIGAVETTSDVLFVDGFDS